MRPCIISYRVNGSNGPWNFMYERPPADADKVFTLTWFIEETDFHYVTCPDYTRTPTGVIPVRKVVFSKDQCTIHFLGNEIILEGKDDAR